jgi:hypothetical protein
MEHSAWVLNLRMSTVYEWNRLFDERMRPVIVPDGRGKATKVTADTVGAVVKAARDLEASGRRLRINTFTRRLGTEKKIVLSKKTVSDILIANDLHKVCTRRRRPRFYQSLCQSIPNGLLSVDGSEFSVWVGDEAFKFNVELAVDVASFTHTAFSVAQSETTEEMIRVLEAHQKAWGNPLGVVCDHGSANLSEQAKAYVQGKGIELVPAGPANPKGNGTAEVGFGEMKEVLGSIRLSLKSPRALAQSVLEKLIGVYIHMRNRIALQGKTAIPEAQLARSVAETDREAQRQRLKRFQRLKSKALDEPRRGGVDRLHWLIDHYGLQVEPSVLQRAERTIKAYEMEAIRAAEEAFVKAVNRKSERLSLPYFFGILKRIQQDRDDQAYRRYCHERYNCQVMKEAERRRGTEPQHSPTINDLVAMLEQAISASIEFVKETAIRQARRMAHVLMETYSYVGVLEKQIANALVQLTHLSLAQKQEAWKLIQQFLSPESAEESVTLKP